MSIFREVSESQRKAIRFLEVELCDGAKEVHQLQTKARTNGIYPRTLTSARKKLRVAVFRESQCGRFFWKMADGE